MFYPKIFQQKYAIINDYEKTRYKLEYDLYVIKQSNKLYISLLNPTLILLKNLFIGFFSFDHAFLRGGGSSGRGRRGAAGAAGAARAVGSRRQGGSSRASARRAAAAAGELPTMGRTTRSAARHAAVFESGGSLAPRACAQARGGTRREASP